VKNASETKAIRPQAMSEICRCRTALCPAVSAEGACQVVPQLIFLVRRSYSLAFLEPP